MQWQTFQRRCIRQMSNALKTRHRQLVVLGLLVVLYYFPTWLRTLVLSVPKGSSNFLVNSAMLALVGRQLWERRHALRTATIVPEERQIGHLLILGGITSFLIYHGSIMAQVVSCSIVLAGIAASSWGFEFFRSNVLVVLLVLPILHPNLERVARLIWEGLTSPQNLPEWMAWGGGLILRSIGQSVTIKQQFLILPTHVVEVASGCDGLNMAFAVGAMGLLMGLWFKSSWKMILLLMGTGVGLALVFNLPRIALMTFAATYWGQAAFEFWHGPIGGQIFSTVLLTVYYYWTMFLLERSAQNGVYRSEK
ncbi:hypothetical protein LEP3755_53730 [Leptolyngbya sp. NIES-3755]|nr:hypothetical protein LEP3755_53730 [Leptolyngbya sp. NIES-3755]